MKSRHSIEIKALLEQKKLNRSRFNPQSTTNITTYSASMPKLLKRSESNSTLRRHDIEMSHIEQRYRILEDQYKKLLLEAQKRNQLFRKQKQQIQKYREAHQRDTKEIQRLKIMVGYSKKSEITTQSTINDEPKHMRGSSLDRRDSIYKQKRSPLVCKDSLMNKDLNKTCKIQTPLKKVNSRIRYEGMDVTSQFSKYKFVPSLPLK